MGGETCSKPGREAQTLSLGRPRSLTTPWSQERWIRCHQVWWSPAALNATGDNMNSTASVQGMTSDPTCPVPGPPNLSEAPFYRRENQASGT